MKIMAIGDLNNDKNADLVVTNMEQDVIKVLLFNDTSKKYNEQ